MRDAYRDDLEAALLRAADLERENAALAARNAELEGRLPAAPTEKHGSGLGVLVVVLLVGGLVLTGLVAASFPDHAVEAGVVMLVFWSIAIGIAVLPVVRRMLRGRK